MSRNKKSRKPGSTSGVEFIVTRNRSSSDVEGRLRKKQKRRKGLKTGNRHSESIEVNQKAGKEERDPRLGSQKKIPLIVEDKKKATKQQRRQSAADELEMLENDAQLNVLLDRIESGERLGSGLQSYVDEKLDRIEILMNQLGLIEPEADLDQPDTVLEGIVEKPIIGKEKQASISDDDLLAQFESLDLNDFKK